MITAAVILVLTLAIGSASVFIYLAGRDESDADRKAEAIKNAMLAKMLRRRRADKPADRLRDDWSRD